MALDLEEFFPPFLLLLLPGLLHSFLDILDLLNKATVLHHCRGLHKFPHQVALLPELQALLERPRWVEFPTFQWANTGNQTRNITTGLTLPRTIRASSWTQLKDIEGCDPLTVPLSKLLYQGSENYWLRKLATGREVYVATMGEVSQVVFVSEILSQLRSRGIDLDKLAQHKALQDGQAMEKKEAIQNLAKLVGDQLQRWYPTIQADTSPQHKIAELEAKIAELQAAANQPPAPSPQAQQPEAQAPPARVQSPLEAAFQGQRPAAFEPAQLLATPGSTNQWLENNMIDSLSDAKYKSWFRNLKLDNPTRQTIERNIVAVDNWWQNQPEEAEATIHRVAVCSGIPPAKIKSGQNENLLKVLTVALTMTA